MKTQVLTPKSATVANLFELFSVETLASIICDVQQLGTGASPVELNIEREVRTILQRLTSPSEATVLIEAEHARRDELLDERR